MQVYGMRKISSSCNSLISSLFLWQLYVTFSMAATAKNIRNLTIDGLSSMLKKERIDSSSVQQLRGEIMVAII